MNIYDKAHEFASYLKDCEEIVKFREISKKVNENEQNKKMLNDLRSIQFKAYSEQIEKGEISKDTKEKLEGLGAVISINPAINEYVQAEYKFGLLWEDIMKILHDAVGIDMDFPQNK
ncbi:YlbF family regulator [Clostridium sp. KNHs214]|uniref:YlbF family regulator n=1 Tax=Clostridium sp. KNHs214 TaxID=1540257 RepID=UPI0005546EC9|nr:YlbF family regulator [Clostridium sp. KNHs214]